MATHGDSPADGDALERPAPTQVASAAEPQRLYFAYGSNMDPEQFRERCPGSEFLGGAVLQDHHWCITDRGVASVREHVGGRVFGVLARLTAEDAARLDVCEGVRRGLYRRAFLEVEAAHGGRVQALVYIANDTGFGMPHPGYLELVLAGARHHGLPTGAIAEIESWGHRIPDPGACTVNVFVYGTLKRGHVNHIHVADGIYVGEAVTLESYALHVRGLPRVDRNNPVSPIHGELYRVTPETLAELDRLEGHPNVYRRAWVKVSVAGGPLVWAWLYFHTAPTGPIEESGRYVGRG